MTCVLDRLDVSTRALKRAQYEAFAFELTGDGVTVRNGSHANPDDHVYTVSVVGGVPTACTCPADEHHESACKHRLAVAIREPVLEAAVANETTDGDEQDDESERERDDDRPGTSPVPVADGAGTTDPAGERAVTVDPERPDDCDCPDDPDGFPCWPCVRDGYRELPSDDRLESTDD